MWFDPSYRQNIKDPCILHTAMLVGSNFIGQWREVIDETEFLIYNGTLR